MHSSSSTPSPQTALHIATHTQQTDMMQKLLSAGASLEITDHKGNTPLHIACRFSSTKCLDEMLRGVPLERVVEVSQIRNHQGQTCVHIATESGSTDTLRKLKSVGVDMNLEVRRGVGMQWNLSIPDTLGSGVSLICLPSFWGSKCTQS